MIAKINHVRLTCVALQSYVKELPCVLAVKAVSKISANSQKNNCDGIYFQKSFISTTC